MGNTKPRGATTDHANSNAIATAPAISHGRSRNVKYGNDITSAVKHSVITMRPITGVITTARSPRFTHPLC